MKMLLIESDKKIIEKITTGFEKCYIVDTALSGYKGMYLSEINDYDVIIIDSILQDMGGVEICRMIRSANIITPIMLISDISKYAEKVMSLDAGADVTISKPVNINEVIAQVRALVRRNGNSNNCHNMLKVGEIGLNIKRRQFFVNEEPIFLRRKEFDLLEYLMINRGKIISKEELLEHVWEKGIYIFSNTVEVHIRNIRVRFEKVVGRNIIRTSRGFGYEIEA